MDRNQGTDVITSILRSIHMADERHVDHNADIDGWLEHARSAVESIRESLKLTPEDIKKIEQMIDKFEGRELLASGAKFEEAEMNLDTKDCVRKEHG